MDILSVIIPVLNENEHLSRLVPLLENDVHVDEIIVVQASENNTPFYHDAKKLKIVNSTRTRRSVQLNEGAKAAQGTVYCFLHADVTPHPEAFAAVKTAVLHGQDFGFFVYEFFPDNILLKINAAFTRRKGIFAGGGDQIHFIRKDLYLSLGGYTDSFEIMEDFELVRRIRKQGIPIALIHLPATVSSRKYNKNSYVRVNFTNLIAFILFTLDCNNRLIKKWCQFMLA